MSLVLSIVSTEKIVKFDGVETRLWNGLTQAENPVAVFVHRLAPLSPEGEAELRAALRETPQPADGGYAAFSAIMSGSHLAFASLDAQADEALSLVSAVALRAADAASPLALHLLLETAQRIVAGVEDGKPVEVGVGHLADLAAYALLTLRAISDAGTDRARLTGSSLWKRYDDTPRIVASGSNDAGGAA